MSKSSINEEAQSMWSGELIADNWAKLKTWNMRPHESCFHETWNRPMKFYKWYLNIILQFFDNRCMINSFSFIFWIFWAVCDKLQLNQGVFIFINLNFFLRSRQFVSRKLDALKIFLWRRTEGSRQGILRPTWVIRNSILCDTHQRLQAYLPLSSWP